MDALVGIMYWLNGVANTAGMVLLAPIRLLPGWLSSTAVAVVTGGLMLLVFKHTSRQSAIRETRDDIKAHLLALKLFRDNAWVMLRAQGRVLAGAIRLIWLALVPMLVMTIPVCLILGQLALWYQARPLSVGETAVVTMRLRPRADASLHAVILQPSQAIQVDAGPVRVPARLSIHWLVRGLEEGYHALRFQVGDGLAVKDVAIGQGFMRVSGKRPGWSWWEVLANPAERPFFPGEPVESIEIDYPPRAAWTSGTDSWMVYWFAVSMVSAYLGRSWIHVEL